MSDDLFRRVKEIALDRVVSDYFTADLKRNGRDLVCRCPVHDEDTPSFHVYVEKNTWHCFGACASGGSAIDLLIKAGIESDALSAAKNLAERYGIEVKENRQAAGKKKPLTGAQYAEFCALPPEFLVNNFSLSDSERGLEMPYKDEAGNVVVTRTRHKLEKSKDKDGRFSWRKGDKHILYGLWRLTNEQGRLVVVEGESDTHVLAYNDIVALGVPGAGNFKNEFATALLPFAEIVVVQEPGDAGEKFVSSITAALKGAKYQGNVRAVSLPEKDPRALWLKSKDKAEFTAAFEKAISDAVFIELYPPIPLTRDLIDKVENLFARHVFFKEKRYPLLLGLWILGTYLHRLFSYFGYLHINSPVLQCGKTLLLDIIGQVAASATSRLSNASESVIFRLADSGATMLLDEAESLRNRDRDKSGNVIALLNAGFQAGAKVPRAQKVGDQFEVVYFNAYCPKALAGINRISDTLSDRSFQVTMTRKTADERVERFSIRRQGKELDAIRAELKLWAGEREKQIAEFYDDIDNIIVSAGDKLRGLDDRFLDIVEPLLSISLFSDCELSNGRGEITERLCGLLRDMAGAKGQLADDSTLAGLVSVLEAFLEEKPGESSIFIRSSDLLAKVQEELPWIDSARKLAGQLKKFGAHSRTSNDRKAKGYHLRREWVKELRARYLSVSGEIYPSYRHEANNNDDLDHFSCRRNDGTTTDEKMN